MPELTPAHSRLAALAGTWRGLESRAASPWAEAGSAEVHLTLTVAVGGFVLIEDYASRVDGADDLTGHGVFSVDPDTEEVLWHFFDSIGYPAIDPARGVFLGDELVLERHSDRGTNRTTWTLTDGELHQTVEFGAAGAEGFEVLVRALYRPA